MCWDENESKTCMSEAEEHPCGSWASFSISIPLPQIEGHGITSQQGRMLVSKSLTDVKLHTSRKPNRIQAHTNKDKSADTCVTMRYHMVYTNDMWCASISLHFSSVFCDMVRADAGSS